MSMSESSVGVPGAARRVAAARGWGMGQASVNPKAETVEELLGRRRTLHLGMLKLAQEDLALALQANHAAFQVL